MQTRKDAEAILATFPIWEDLGTKTQEELIDWLLTGAGQALHAGDAEAFEDALFDEAIFLDEGWTECPYCCREIKARKPPAADDEVGWKRAEGEHSQRCFKTRAGQVVPATPKKLSPGVQVRKAKVPVLRVVESESPVEF